MKLLSPAGNFECLKTAVYNGADEIYLGINEFNARNNVDGFTLDTLEEAVDFAHLYGVKVHLAINILFSDEELQSALDTAVKAFNMGVDAFIVQDLGLAYLLNEHYPEIEKHASTQMGIHNLEGVKAIEKYGFKRVVLARETPLDEIKRIKDNSDIEIEYFAHGALCVSFSGNCYLSSYLNSASGNRGRCKQLCRLPYELIKDGLSVKKGYLLSAKDFNMSNRLVDLESVGVDAIKIEGRARRSYYVGAVTREYRRALDGLKADDETLKLAFNRGFNEGYFNGNGKMISDVQNHVGIHVGEIVKVNNGKNFNEIILSSNRELSAKSSFKIFGGKKERAVITAYDLTNLGGGKYRITTTTRLEVGDRVNLISDYDLEKALLEKTKKIPLEIRVKCSVGQPIKAITTLYGEMVEVEGDVLMPAQKQPLTKAELCENFNKSEYFLPQVEFECGGDVFIPKSRLNEFRRNLYGVLKDRITYGYKKDVESVKIDFADRKVVPFNDFEIVEDLNCEFSAKNVIYSPEKYEESDVKKFVELCVSRGREPYLDTPNFALSKDVELISKIIEEVKVKTVANNYYALTFKGQKVIGAGLNVYNSYSATLHPFPVITAESFLSERIDFPYMTLRHCPIKSHLGGKCDKCEYSDGIELKMESGKKLKLKRKKLSTCTFYLTD